MHGGHDGRMRLTIDRWRRRHNTRYAGYRGGQHRHVGTGHHGEFTAWYVTANRLHGNVLVAQNHTGQGFNLHIGHAGALRLSKSSYLSLCKFNIVQISGAYLAHGFLNLGVGQAKRFSLVVVKLLRHVVHSGIATGFYI